MSSRAHSPLAVTGGHTQLVSPAANQGLDRLYAQALHRGRRARTASSRAACSDLLLSLDEVAAACPQHACSHTVARTVPLGHIRGSDGRCSDFESDFRPLHDRTKERWLSIASAQQRGKTLPPVALIQVGDVYFVQDGHHRISVARALGQETIEAQVVVWQVAGLLPWQTPVGAPGHAPKARQAAIAPAGGEIWRTGVRLRQRIRRGLHDLLTAVGHVRRSHAVPALQGGGGSKPKGLMTRS